MIPGFWAIFFANKRRIFLHPYFGLAIVIGVIVACLPENDNLQRQYTQLLTIAASISVSALLGMVLAGLALVVTLTSPEVLRASARIGRGVVEDYFPFSLTASLAVLTTVVSLIFLIFTSQDDTLTIRIGVGVSMGLFVWALLNVLALVRFVAQRGVTNALEASRSDSNGAGEADRDRSN